MSGDDGDRWLSLGEASALLGVHVSTLRRWSDTGRVPVRRTAGGHRRFNERQLRSLVQTAPDSPRSRARGKAEDQAWHAALEKAALVEPLRAVGQRLGGVLIQAVVAEDEALTRHLDQARALGGQYGDALHAAGVDVLTATEAFVHYRASFVNVLAQFSPHEGPHLVYARYDDLMNEVLLGLIEAYREDGAGAS